MDILFHFTVGLIISKLLTGNYLILAGLFSMLPDLAGLIIRVKELIDCRKSPLKKIISDFRESGFKGKFYAEWCYPLYRSTHNLFTWLIVTVFSYLFFPNIFWLLPICYLSHIIIDIYSHQKGFATRLFFPFSDFHIEGRTWADWRIFGFSWGALLLLVILTFYS
ncbi:MAG: hypothetical protein ISS48_02810 [Candidatus Aenigmarchaeota archaeon]|nr:hypothetical protein [Candidatus Aenigmarchaeota archaeon]